MEVFKGEDDDIHNIFEEHYGPKNETTFNFFWRSFDKFCDSIANPQRSVYSTKDLTIPGFETSGFNLLSHNGMVLSCCFWKNLNTPQTQPDVETSSKKVVLYMHTNTRNLSDASEVVPLCNHLDADLISFDLQGAGKSEGFLTPNSYKDILIVVQWIQSRAGNNVEILLWARGMSTAIAIDFCHPNSQFHCEKTVYEDCQASIKAMILDTPFESIKKMVDECIEKIEAENHYVPSSLISMFSLMARRAIKNKMHGIDPYSIEPLAKVHEIFVPCFIFASTNDDYIPLSHSLKIVEACGGASCLKVHELPHFGQRPAAVIESVFPFLDRRIVK